MKYAQATIRYTRSTPRKMRLVADLIRGLSVSDAYAQLSIISRRATTPLAKLLSSAVANAKNMNMDSSKLYVSYIAVDQGPMLKRFLPRARGSASPLQKKMSHTTIRLAEKEGVVNKFTITPKPKKQPKTGGVIAPKAENATPATPKKEEKGILKRILGRGGEAKPDVKKGRAKGNRGSEG